jgi:hypothetical protein
MNRRIVDCVAVAHIMSYVRSCKHFDKLLRAVRKSRRPWSLAKQRFRHTIRRGKIMLTSELVSNKEELYILILCKAFHFLSNYQVLFLRAGTKFLVKTNFFPIHNTRPTICILFFLRHLYCNITLRILTCFNPQGVNIEVTTFSILLV